MNNHELTPRDESGEQRFDFTADIHIARRAAAAAEISRAQMDERKAEIPASIPDSQLVLEAMQYLIDNDSSK